MANIALEILAVAGAGAAGAVSRFLIGKAFGPTEFPVATLLINVTGSFVLGWFLTAIDQRYPVSDVMRHAVAIGFVGAYTTFSTYMFDTNKMLTTDRPIMAIVYLAGSIVLGLMAVRAGILLGGAK